ncbi:MAG: ribosome biogenesis GTPase Der [Thermoguttaceae bacterium]
MGVPQVAIVGRPNVGKSSVLNWLAGRRIAIVDPTAGVTRDRVTQLVNVRDRFVELVDTGGMGIEDVDDLTEHIDEQIQTAIDTADLILFVVDTLDGPMPLDSEVAKRLRYVTTPVICVANKTDNDKVRPQADEFYKLGRKVLPVSVKQNRGKSQLLDEINERLPEPVDGEEEIEATEMKVAIVGRRNTGKSTFINTLTNAERMITSEVPGTTRDSVDVRFKLDGKSFLAIDTPGFRRRKSVASNVDFYSTHRAERSIRRADVVLLFFDASQRISKVDKQLCDYIAEQYKPCIFVVNKWDLMAKAMLTGKWVEYLRDTFRTMWHVPIAFVTGQTGKNLKAMLNHSQMLFKQCRSRISTAQLNKLVRAAIDRNPPPLHRHRRPKIYYAVQVASQPPTIVLFCNSPQAIAAPYKRYLLGVFRDQLEFGEVPIKLYLRKRERDDYRDQINTKLKK